jgi:hypothetical protein
MFFLTVLVGNVIITLSKQISSREAEGLALRNLGNLQYSGKVPIPADYSERWERISKIDSYFYSFLLLQEGDFFISGIIIIQNH